MTKDKPFVSSRSDVPARPADDDIAERRKGLAHLIGRLLARNWLQQHDQTDNANSELQDE